MKKIIASFAGGVITAIVGNHFIKTDKARTIAVNSENKRRCCCKL